MTASITATLPKQQLFSVTPSLSQYKIDCLRQLVRYDVISYQLTGAASMPLHVPLITAPDRRISCYGCLVEGTLEVSIALLA